MSYLQPINRLNAEGNLSGITRLQVARKSHVSTFPDPTGRTLYGTITFLPDTGFVNWDVTLETPRNRSQDQPTREGASKRKTIAFTIPKDREDLRTMLELAERDEFIVVLIDGNGKQKIVGTPWAPLLFSFAHDSGGAFNELNGYQCQFYYDGPDNEYFYPGTATPAPAGPSPALVRFNGTVIASLQPGEILDITSDYGFTEYHTSSIT